jgi:hypothetical protein
MASERDEVFNRKSKLYEFIKQFASASSSIKEDVEKLFVSTFACVFGDVNEIIDDCRFGKELLLRASTASHTLIIVQN